MNLLLAARGGFDNPKSWSGTPFTLKQLFSKKDDIHLETINWEIRKLLLRSYFRIYGKIFFIAGTARDPVLNPLFRRRITREIKPFLSNFGWLLFISDYVIPDIQYPAIKFAAYFDSFLADILHLREDNKTGKNMLLKHYEKYNRLYLSRMSLIFTQNEWSRRAVIKNYAIAQDKVLNVGFGINVTPYYGDKDYNSELLLIVLRKEAEKYKGLLLLLDAFRLLRLKRPSAKLAVVGSDTGSDQEGVTCYFNQPREVTVELFKKSSLYVMPALHEPNGITYLEALASKTPVVGLNRFAFPEFAGNGEWGFIVENPDPRELADVINSALEDKHRLAEMGKMGQEYVLSRFSWDIVVDKMINSMKNHSDQTSAYNPQSTIHNPQS